MTVESRKREILERKRMCLSQKIQAGVSPRKTVYLYHLTILPAPRSPPTRPQTPAGCPSGQDSRDQAWNIAVQLSLAHHRA